MSYGEFSVKRTTKKRYKSCEACEHSEHLSCTGRGCACFCSKESLGDDDKCKHRVSETCSRCESEGFMNW